MIWINKKDIPEVLVNHQTVWTKDLMDAVDIHKGYDKIPKKLKEKLISHYHHKDIQNVLFESSHDKCAFCECKPGQSGNREVEHFEPKSLYPDRTFDWDNLLPACRKCNEAKGDFDTRTVPIVNPTVENPELILTYNFLEVIPLPGTKDEKKVDDTIRVCNLNSPRLYSARADIMKSVAEYMDELREKIKLIEEADTRRKKNIRINSLNNSLEKIDVLMQNDSAFSGYSKWLILKYPEYEKAQNILKNR